MGLMGQAMVLKVGRFEAVQLGKERSYYILAHEAGSCWREKGIESKLIAFLALRSGRKHPPRSVLQGESRKA